MMCNYACRYDKGVRVDGGGGGTGQLQLRILCGEA